MCRDWLALLDVVGQNRLKGEAALENGDVCFRNLHLAHFGFPVFGDLCDFAGDLYAFGFIQART